MMTNKYKYMKLMVDAKNYFVKIFVYFQECFYKERLAFIVQITSYFIYLLVINIINSQMIKHIIL